MKNRKTFVGKKGMEAISIAIIGAIILIVVVLTMLVPIVFMKVHIVRVVDIQYGYSNADLALLALLSDNDIYEKLSFYISDMEDNAAYGFNREDVKAQVTEVLDKLVPSDPDTRCYELSYDGGVIIPSDKCDIEFSASVDMALPYGKTTEKLTLEIR